MSRALLLIGAGGLARETAEAVRARGVDELVGFLDDDPALWGTSLDGLPVLGGTSALPDHPDAQIVLCPGSGRARAAIAARLGLADERYATVVHPGVLVPASCTVGVGTVLLAGAVLTTAVTVGRHVVVMPGSVLTHDVVLEDAATLCARVALAGGVRIRSAGYLGAGCVVREHVSVGLEATVGMGAVVLRDVPDGEVWPGVPARRLDRTGADDVPHSTESRT